jgi:hypothetical protein
MRGTIDGRFYTMNRAKDWLKWLCWYRMSIVDCSPNILICCGSCSVHDSTYLAIAQKNFFPKTPPILREKTGIILIQAATIRI